VGSEEGICVFGLRGMDAPSSSLIIIITITINTNLLFRNEDISSDLCYYRIQLTEISHHFDSRHL